MLSRFRQWLRRLSASPAGSEAIAQGTEAMAAGTRGVSVKGNVQTRVIITGGGNTIHHGPALPDPAAALAVYCRTLDKLSPFTSQRCGYPRQRPHGGPAACRPRTGLCCSANYGSIAAH